jgi:CBS domain containing-hemolysin-like protein
MNSKMTTPRTVTWRASARLKGALLPLVLALPSSAHASLFHGETLDKVADVMTWVVLAVVPVVAIGVFLLIHILPEKIAEKKHHPQTKAIQCLCLLSLFFGGLLWPLAWLWAYTRPVLHQLAYGTDKVVHGSEGEVPTVQEVANGPVAIGAIANGTAAANETAELNQLRARVAELESKLAGTAVADTTKA